MINRSFVSLQMNNVTWKPKIVVPSPPGVGRLVLAWQLSLSELIVVANSIKAVISVSSVCFLIYSLCSGEIKALVK